MFRNMLIFYGEKLLAPRPIQPKLDDHLSSAVLDCLFNTFSVTLHNWRPFHQPQPEDAPCRGDRDLFITMMTGAHLSRWQGPTYHGDRGPLITVTGTHLSRWQGPTYHGDRGPLITGLPSIIWKCTADCNLFTLATDIHGSSYNFYSSLLHIYSPFVIYMLRYLNIFVDVSLVFYVCNINKKICHLTWKIIRKIPSPTRSHLLTFITFWRVRKIA